MEAYAIHVAQYVIVCLLCSINTQQLWSYGSGVEQYAGNATGDSDQEGKKVCGFGGQLLTKASLICIEIKLQNQKNIVY